MAISRETRYALRVADKLLHLAQQLSAEVTLSLDELCLGRTQAAIVKLVVEGPGIGPAALAANLAVDKSAVSRAVRRLEVCGYVERRRSHSDRRAWELHPTSRAHRAAWILGPTAWSPEARLLAGFSAEELEQLDACLERLAANLGVTLREVRLS